MTGSKLIGSFFFAQIFDVVSTVVGINFLNLIEMNPLANYLFELLGMEEFMVFKIYLAAFLIGCYLLTIKRFPRWLWSIEKSLQIGSLLTWAIVFLNFVELSFALGYQI